MGRPRNPINTLNKTCPTCKIPFTCEKRKEKTYCSKTCACNSPEVKEKNRLGVAKSFDKKYGCHAMQTKQVVKNFKTSMMKKYGKDAALQVKSIMESVKRTTFENHGVECVFSKDSPIRIKIVDTWMKKYGVDNPGKSREVIKKRGETHKSNHYEELLVLFEKEQVEWLIKAEDYLGYHFSKRYSFRCKKCGHSFESTVYVPNDIFCELCFPQRKQTGEISLLEFLNSELNGKVVSRNNRVVLDGKELDFYIPELKLAIEYNGLYWHRESQKVSKNYHLDKTDRCLQKGIRLLHIYETEWLNKANIVKSILRQAIGGSVIKIHGRECEVKKVGLKEKREFLKICHIQGDDRSSVAYGIYYKNNLVSLMSFCRSRFDKKYEWEISRFCNALNTKIHGGASKLFSSFIQDYQPKSVVSYSDRRFFSGEVYEKLGMKFVGFTAQGYHYISADYKALFNRQSFQKSKLKEKLEVFDPELSEWENMKANGFGRIWDSGHSKWVWTTQSS